MHSSQILSASAVSRLTGWSIKHVVAMSERGALPCVLRTGNRRYFARADIEKLFAGVLVDRQRLGDDVPVHTVAHYPDGEAFDGACQNLAETADRLCEAGADLDGVPDLDAVRGMLRVAMETGRVEGARGCTLRAGRPEHGAFVLGAAVQDLILAARRTEGNEGARGEAIKSFASMALEALDRVEGA